MDVTRVCYVFDLENKYDFCCLDGICITLLSDAFFHSDDAHETRNQPGIIRDLIRYSS